MSQNKDIRNDHVSRVNRVIDYLRSDLSQDLSLDYLANKAALSKFHFHRVFSDVCGETPNAYVKRVRVESSAFALIFDPRVTLTSVAYDFGFSSSAVYSRAFKDRYGMSPTQWREAWKQKGEAKSNTGQSDSKRCKVSGQPTFYLDPMKSGPHWRVDLSDSRTFDIDVHEMAEFDVAYVRHHGSYDPSDSNLFGSLFSELMAWAIPRGKFNPRVSKVITQFSGGHPLITEPRHLTVDACVSIDSNAGVSGSIGQRKIAAGLYAVVELANATLSECQNVWDIVFDLWIHKSGYRFGPGGFYCSHLNDPQQHPQTLHDVKFYFSVVPQGN